MTTESPKAVIWDMDGVIVDTAPYHEEAWRETFQKRGVEFTDEDFRRSFGQRNDTIISGVLGNTPSRKTIDVIANDKETNFRRKIRQRIEPLPGVIQLLSALAAGGFRQALATSAPLQNVRQIIKDLGIEGYFGGIVTEKDVTEGKPGPQGFLLAARKLGVEPEDCIIIEDAVVGVTAAKRAGMDCVAVTNTHRRSRLREADLIVDSLEDVTVTDLEALLSRPRVGS
ncbi:MAG: HAD family phosphatase [Dehalococcoidales bacterium]|nr:MAG: HAD family phosphatase [Dehalococcoidales bacterium]